MKGSEKYMIWVAPEGQDHVFHFDEKNAKLCEIMKTEDLRLPRECVLFGHENVQNKDG